jgi:drug/metabolite transporter (DMT)-like permease
VVLMLGATLCWATAGMLVRNMDLRDGWEITFWRSLFMTLVISGVLIYQYRGATLARFRAVGSSGLITGALWALMYVCFILALGRTTVANVLVLSAIAPFSSALLGRFVLGERVPRRTWAAMLMAFGGIVLMFLEAIGAGGLVGNLIALVIPIAFGANVTLLRRTHAQVDMVPTLVLSGVISMAVTLPLALPFTPSGKDLGLLAIMGAIQLGLGLVLMMLATPHLAAAEIGLLAVTETLFGSFLTWLAVGERPGAMTLAGGGIAIGAIVVNELFGLRSRAHPGEDEAVREVSGAGH